MRKATDTGYMSAKPLHDIAKRCPLAVSRFVSWVKARDETSTYLEYLKRPADALPLEMLFGMLILFFAENGVVVTFIGTKKGRYRSLVHAKRMSGLFEVERTERFPKDTEVAMQLVINNCFSVLQARLKRVQVKHTPEDPTDVVVGLDIEAFLNERGA